MERFENSDNQNPEYPSDPYEGRDPPGTGAFGTAYPEEDESLSPGIEGVTPADGSGDIPDDPLGDHVGADEPDNTWREALENAPLQGPRETSYSRRADTISDAFEPRGSVLIRSGPEGIYIRHSRIYETDPKNPRHADIIGGIGITRRTLKEADDEVPGVANRLLEQTGKIVFLGNGLSTAPLEVLDRHTAPDNKPEVIAVDALDYRALQSDLHRLRRTYDAALVDVPPSLNDAIAKCDALLVAADEGRLRIVKCMVGEDELPPETKNADMVVNIYGPPPELTLQEQIDCLKPGGQLYTSYTATMDRALDTIDITDRARPTPLNASDRQMGYKIERLIDLPPGFTRVEPMPTEQVPLQGPKEMIDSPRLKTAIDTFEPEGNVVFRWSPITETLFMRYARPGFDATEERDPIIGGTGITYRSLEEINNYLPGVLDAIKTEPGKVVFMGNGLSPAPLDAVGKYQIPAESVMVLDAVDYPTMQTDLERLQATLDQRLLSTPISVLHATQQCERINRAAAAGKITQVKCVVGTEPIPEAAKNADLIINAFGPPPNTIPSQLEALKPGGRLFINAPFMPSELPNELCEVTPVHKNGKLRCYILTKPSKPNPTI